jgi:hypothetical protein
LKAGLWVRRVRFAILSPDPRHLRRSQADLPLIGLSEFPRPPLYLTEVGRGFLNGYRDDIEYLPLGALDLRVGFALIGIDVLGFSSLDDDFSALRRALAEYLCDLFACLLDRLHQRLNHVGQLKAIVLVQRADEGRLEIGGKLEVADMESHFDLRQGETLFVAEIERALCLPTPLDHFKRDGMAAAVFVIDG